MRGWMRGRDKWKGREEERGSGGDTEYEREEDQKEGVEGRCREDGEVKGISCRRDLRPVRDEIRDVRGDYNGLREGGGTRGREDTSNNEEGEREGGECLVIINILVR